MFICKIWCFDLTESDKHNDKIEAMMVKNMLKADEKQQNQFTVEEFKKLPIPEEVIKLHMDQCSGN